ncbi:MAG: lysostaphin resistance A-like protein [Bacilli bacterium]
MVNYIKGSRIKNFFNVVLYFFNNIFVLGILTTIFIINSDIDINNISNEKATNIVFSDMMVIMFITTLITLILLVIININELKQQLLLNIKNKYTYFYPILLIIVYFVIMAIFTFIVEIINPNLSEPENNQSIINMFNSGNTFVFIINVVFIAPIVEELIFRYSIVNIFHINNKIFSWVPYMISAIIFAFIHEVGFITNFTLDNLLQFLTYFIPALILSFGYMFTKRNIVSMFLLHIFINSMATLAIVFNL